MDKQMKLDVATRHKIYKRTKLIFESGYSSSLCRCMLLALHKLSIISKDYYFIYCDSDLIKKANLIEFIETKPKNARWNAYWWDENDKSIRIKVLNELIEKTK